MPTISKLDAFIENVPELMENLQTDGQNDFSEKNIVRICTPNNSLVIDWSEPTSSIDLFKWESSLT